MKTKPLLITVSILALVAVIAWRAQVSEPDAADGAHPWIGKTLLDPDVLVKAEEIHLSGDDETTEIVLRRADDGRWFLPDHFGIPVDFDKLSRFTQSLLDAEVQRHVTDNPARLERLELGANRVVLVGEDGAELWSLENGARPEKGGDYLRFNDEDSAYLTHTSLYFDTTLNNWMARQPLDFDESDVASVTLAIGEETLTFERDEEGADFKGVDLAENETAKAAEVSRLVRTLINARFTEAVDAGGADAQAARDHARKVFLELFDGNTYTLHIGRRPAVSPQPEEEPRIETTSASIVFDSNGEIVEEENLPAASPTEGDSEEGEEPEPGPVFVFYESSAAAFRWNSIMEEAALQFPDRILEELPTSTNALIETRDPSDASADEEEDHQVPKSPEAAPVPSAPSAQRE